LSAENLLQCSVNNKCKKVEVIDVTISLKTAYYLIKAAIRAYNIDIRYIEK